MKVRIYRQRNEVSACSFVCEYTSLDIVPNTGDIIEVEAIPEGPEFSSQRYIFTVKQRRINYIENCIYLIC